MIHMMSARRLCGSTRQTYALQSQRLQWEDACLSLQYALQCSTLPSSLEAGVHATVPRLPVMAASDSASPGAALPPQNAQARHEHWLQ